MSSESGTGKKKESKVEHPAPAPSVTTDTESEPFENVHYPSSEDEDGWILDDVQFINPPENWLMDDPSETWKLPIAGEAVNVPPAPVVHDESAGSLLDTFAAHALDGLLAGMLSVPNTSLNTSDVAHMAYNYAEAMLRERQRRLDNQIPSPAPSAEKPGHIF